MNFPTKCFYNKEYNQIQTFYRQGHSFRISTKVVETKNMNESTYDMEDESFIF